MILIVTSKDDVTADFLTQRLKRSDFLRIDTEDLPSSVRISSTERASSFEIGRRSYRPLEFTGVWYRRPKPILFPTNGRKAEARHAASEYASALEGVLALIPESKWINHPARNVGAGHKLEQIRRASRFGLKVPKTLVTQDVVALRQFWSDCSYGVILKPISHGYIERKTGQPDSLIYTNALREEDLNRETEINRCPTLFQERIDKISDIRVTVVDGDIQAAELHARDDGIQRLDIRRNNMVDVRYQKIELPRDVCSKLTRLLRSYRLRFAAIDLVRRSDGQLLFLEINPNGQWAWLDMARVTDSRRALIKALGRSSPR